MRRGNQEGTGNDATADGMTMPPDREPTAVRDRPEGRTPTPDDPATIVLDVDHIDDTTSTLSSGTVGDQRLLPDELLGMYYHG